jgi:glucose-1-phosphate cytidylyltransferase
MKVVLFCGGLGIRMREYSETIPKPMVEIGYRPIIWHLMRYYAAYGHREFILCLGHGGSYIKRYFLNYDECLSNDFVLSRGGREVQLFNRDIEDWKLTFVDTGLHANIGQRLCAVKPYLEDDEAFLANYTDGLSDLHLPSYLEFFQRSARVASFLAVRPAQSFHVVSVEEDGRVGRIAPVADSEIWINGGFFAFRREIFDFLRDGEELVEEPFRRLIGTGQLVAYRHRGFFACLDTYKEKQLLDDLYARDEMPWAVWRNGAHGGPHGIAGPTEPAADAGVETVAGARGPRHHV